MVINAAVAMTIDDCFFACFFIEWGRYLPETVMRLFVVYARSSTKIYAMLMNTWANYKFTKCRQAVQYTMALYTRFKSLTIQINAESKQKYARTFNSKIANIL